MRRARTALAVAGALLCMAAAADPTERLADPGQEARARALFAQVRCLVCQNESIDDSQAELAADLRALVRQEISVGHTDAQIKTYLVSRYGEFVLLKPAFSWSNGALWGAPLGVLAIGFTLLARSSRRRSEDPILSDDEARRLSRLAEDGGA